MFTVVLLSALAALADARVYDRCELGRELMRHGVGRDYAARWVCIAYHESRFDTAAHNWNSGDHGIFQISELYWCGQGKACGVPCSAFRNDDISDDIRCSLRIHEEHTRLQGDGFLAWVVYPQHCRHSAKKYLANCDIAQVKYVDRNDTAARDVSRQNIHKSKLRYLAVSELVKNSYSGRSYNESRAPLERSNFKINNIDQLKLPTLKKNPTHTTVDTSLIEIMPPSPKRIESNQFRRRLMNSIPVETKYDTSNDYVPRKWSEVTTSKAYTDIDLSQNFFINLYKQKTFNNFSGTERPVEVDLSNNPFINLYKLKTSMTFTDKLFWARGLSTHSPSYFGSFTTATQRNNVNLISISKQDNEESVPIKSFVSVPSTREASTVIDLSHNPFINLYKLTAKTPYLASESTNHPTSYVNRFTTTTPRTTTTQRSTISERTVSAYNNDSNDTKKIMYDKKTSPLAGSASDITHKPTSTTTTVRTTRFPIFHYDKTSTQATTSKPKATSVTIPTSATTKRPFWTTYKSPTTRTVATSITASPVSRSLATKVTPVQNSTEATPITKSTWSVFDLYLRPTKATLKPFQFSPFPSSYKLSIISGGTTAPPPTYASKS